MPWRGPAFDGDFPSLGGLVGAWIEDHLVVGDGFRRGEKYLLTDEMWRFCFKFYRLYEHAEPYPSPDGLYYYGAQFRRSQKYGKDPFGAALIAAEAEGPTRFAGWATSDDDDPLNFRWDGKRILPGEPIGIPYPTPLIVCLGTSEDQTDNTWRPLLQMIRGGKLIDLPGMDCGQTRIDLPGGGRIEPVTTSAKARLGAPLTFLTITESHLFTLQGGFRRVCAAVKRNVAGMDGRWLELTNAWDPTEGSEAQVTAESGDPRVLIDTIEPHRVEDLADETAVYRELLRQYGDSARERGGWVNIKGRIMDEMASKRHLPADKRRFFLNEIVVGESVLVDPIRWDLMAREDQLQPGDEIALGFDGSKYQDATALVAARHSDGRLFCLRIWERPTDALSWTVPAPEVDRVLTDVFGAYKVGYLFADPYRWQSYLDTWSARWPKQIVEFPTNVEQRMDKAIERFSTAFAGGEVTHDGHERFAWHMKNAVIVKGSRRKIRPGEDELLPTHYLKLAKRGDGQLIDGAVAAVLALAALGQSVEDNMWETEPTTPFFAAWR